MFAMRTRLVRASEPAELIRAASSEQREEERKSRSSLHSEAAEAAAAAQRATESTRAAATKAPAGATAATNAEKHKELGATSRACRRVVQCLPRLPTDRPG